MVDPVILKLQADVTKYNSDVTASAKLTEQQLARIEASGEKMGASLKEGFSKAREAAAAFVAILAVASITEAVKTGLEYAASLGEQAKQLGLTTAALQEYHYAATQVGVSQEQFDEAIGHLTKNIGQAVDGSKAQTAAFKALGVSLVDTHGRVISTSDAIPKIAEALKAVGNPAQQAALTVELFGRAGEKLLPLLLQGKDGINQFSAEAQKLGIVLSDDVIEQAHDAEIALDRLNFELKADLSNAIATNATAIVSLASALEHLVASSVNFISTYPRLSGALAGALAGSRFGLPGAVVGAAVGVVGGQSLAQDQANSNMNLQFRMQQQSAALAEVKRQMNPDRSLGGMFTVHSGASSTSLADATTKLQQQNALLKQATEDTVNRKTGGGAVYTPAVAVPKVPKVRTGTGAQGPTAEDIEKRFEDQLTRYQDQVLSAKEQMAKSAEEEAGYQDDAVDRQAARNAADIDAIKGLSDAQRATLDAANTQAADARKAVIAFQESVRLQQEAQQLAEQQNQNQSDALQLQAELADTQKERQAIALKTVDLEYQYQKAVLDAILASQTATDAEKKRAALALSGLNANHSLQTQVAIKQNQGPLAAYITKIDPKNNDEQVQTYVVSELQSVQSSIHDAISSVIGTKDPLINGLIDLLIQNVVIKPLADALSKASSGGGGGLFGSILSGIGAIFGGGAGSLINGVSGASFASGIGSELNSMSAGLSFGRASGGYVGAGQMVRVNEGSSPGRVEGFIPSGGGNVIPLGRMNAAAATPASQEPAVVEVHLMEGQLFEPRVQQISGNVSVQVVRSAAPQLIDASARETLSRASRTRL